MLGAELTMLMPESLRHVHRAGLEELCGDWPKTYFLGVVELPGLHKKGKEISLELLSESSKGWRPFFTGIARDITSEKQDEHAWRCSTQ